jgi:hypothetical protein
MLNESIFMEASDNSKYSFIACGQAGCPAVFALVESIRGG